MPGWGFLTDSSAAVDGETSVAWEQEWIWTVSSGISGYSLGLWHVNDFIVMMSM